jgi:hypothetical protein
MRGKLRKVNEGIIFTIDERPPYIEDEVYFRQGELMSCNLNDENFYYDILDHKILASTFGVGLELKVNYKGKFQEILNGKHDGVEMDKEYPYKIEDGKVIIEL